MAARATHSRRHGSGARREVSRALTSAAESGSGLGGILGAKAYTPRGRTIREAADHRRELAPDGGTDSRRPVLRVVEGGQTRRVEDRRAEPARLREEERAPRRHALQGTGGRLTRRRTSAQSARRAREPRRAPLSRRLNAQRPPRLADPRRRLRLATVLALGDVRDDRDPAGGAPGRRRAGVRRRRPRRSTRAPIVIPAPRGSIYDRDGAVLAHSVEARYVYADPDLVEDPAGAAPTRWRRCSACRLSELLHS